MSLLDRFFGRDDDAVSDRREPTIGAASEDFASTDSYPEWFREYVLGPKTSSGKSVTPKTAMRQSAVFAAVNLRSGTLAQCPFVVFKRVGRAGSDQRRPDPDHPLHQLLTLAPNGWQTIMDFVQMLQMHCDLRGNGYARIIRDGAGRVVELIPMQNVTVLIANDGSLFYDWRNPRTGKMLRLPQREVFHLRSLTDDGYIGMSRVTASKETVGTMIAAQEYTGRMLSRDARPSVAVKHPKKIGEDTLKRLKTQWEATYGGSENAGKTAILEEGMEVQVIQMTNRESQFLELINASIRDIARFYDVPGFLIGDDSKTTTFASAEQAVQMFEKFTMAKIARNWELTIRRDLLRADERKKWSVEVSLQALTRGDFRTRTEGYARAVGGPYMLANEARRLENMPDVPGGDVLNQPQSTTPRDQEPDDQQRTPPEPDDEEQDTED